MLRAPDPVRKKANEAAFKTPGPLARFLIGATVQTPALALSEQSAAVPPFNRIRASVPTPAAK